MSDVKSVQSGSEDVPPALRKRLGQTLWSGGHASVAMGDKGRGDVGEGGSTFLYEVLSDKRSEAE